TLPILRADPNDGPSHGGGMPGIPISGARKTLRHRRLPLLRLPRLLVLTGLLSLAPLPGTARGDDMAPESVQPPKALKKLSLEELFDVEVTSVSKKSEPVSRTAAAIHVVTSDDIHR